MSSLISIDYEKAFDSVWQSGLIYKLYQYGVKGKFFKVIKSMYSSIKSCVKTDESSITEMFSCNKGIRQGDGLSPVLFSLFMNDLPQYFRDDHCPGVMLGSHSLNCLMYADDLLVLSPSPEGLQKSINVIKKHAEEWKLKVNTKKSNIISKVLEKCVFSYVFPFFQREIYHLQDGFVCGRSCVTSLLRSTHAFAKALDERKQVDTVFLDYSKAFDSVSFNCLLKELFDVGVRSKLLSWFRSYLTCRHHRTVIDGCESSLLPISSGVPQGSNLGPLLFIIYINTAPKAIHSSTTVQLYADDMKCFRIIDNTDDVQQLQSDLSNLNDWSANHFMEFNSKKCKYLAITRKKNIVDSAYTLNGSQIMSVLTEKDLGVHVSTKLSWNNHIDVIISKANKMLGMIKRTCTNQCDQKTLLILYKSLVRSQLEYASQVWSPYTKEKITALERVQRRATKFILKTDLSYPERLVKLKLLPLEYRREMLDLCFFFKCLKGYIDFNVLSYVNFKTPKYNIRNSEATLEKGLFKTDVFKFSFFNRIVDLWNCLPLGMRTIEHFSLFKSSITKFYLNKFNVNKDRFL